MSEMERKKFGLSYLEALYLKYLKIKDRLQDEESKEIFDVRVEYLIERDVEKVLRFFENRYSEWSCPEVELFQKKFPGKRKFILFGAGNVGKKTKKYLEMCGYHPIAFCDNDSDAIGKQVEGIPVISVEEAVNYSGNAVIVICSILYRQEMYSQLLESGYDSDKILVPGGGMLEIVTGRQYFDVFLPGEKEIFIDAGSYNGNTTKEFFEWADSAEKSYILEPHPVLFDQIKRDFAQDTRVITYNCAAWNKEEVLFFKADETPDARIWGGSKISSEGILKVNAINIDSLCKAEDIITFIKMDVEGSEYKALKGAKKIICRDKPKLAISLYHKPQDIIELPDYILSLVPEYRFYIRHYTAGTHETVLYAIVE